MSGSQDGDATSRQRSVSPTKRSAALMEGLEEVPVTSPADTAMPDAASTAATTANASSPEDVEDPPPYSASADVTSPSGSALTIDEQVEQIQNLVKQPLSEGQKGFVVSYKWLGRVLSRSSAPPADRDFDKDAAVGDIGSIDNSDIVAPGAFDNGITPFEKSEHPFIPLLPGLTLGHEFEILPEEAWTRVMAWYGLAEGQKPIVRFAHNTAPLGAASNMIFETYPPIFTIRKVIPDANRSSPPTPPATSNTSQTNTGTTTPEKSSDPSSVQIVASRTERFQSFLARSKTAAGISLKHKVKIWRQLNATEVGALKPGATSEPGMLTPATSRSASPSAPSSSKSPQSLVIPSSVFSKWDEGTDYEEVSANDETANEKYNGKTTLGTIDLGQDQVLILEEQIRGPAGGDYASDARRKATKALTLKSKDSADSGRASPAPSGPVTRGRTKRNGRARGTIGLTNLGNTCYMNSALQCISRVEELALYFLHSNFKKDINPNNPLGYGGRMAKAYADLLSGLYSPNATSAFRPSQFKSALAAAQPMFSGYGQQDSQEFLSFLVDALHEDLNRIQKKPYIENPDSDDNTVHDPEAIKALGQTYQDNHRLRNDSVAMDLFNGFYKNTMVCPDCDKVSVTFDPYSLLTLQLPIENTWRGTIYFVPHVGTPTAYEIDMDKNSTWKSVKQFIASKSEGVTPDRLMFAEVFGHKVYKVFNDKDTIAESSIQPNDVLCMYELPESPTNASYMPKKRGYRSIYSDPDPPLPGMESALADRMAVPVMHSRGESRGGSPNFVLQPTFILLTREEAKDYDAILRKALAAVAPMTSRPFLEEFSSDRPLPSTEADASQDTAASKDEDTAATDPEGRLSDRSIPSEDGYVDVTLQGDNESQQQGGPGVLCSTTPLPSALRDLFELKYVGGSSGDMFCTGNGSLGSAKPMQDRVETRRPRRDSLESRESSTSHGSQDSAISTSRRSTPSSDEDEPALIIGGETTGFTGDVQSDEEPPQPAPSTMSAKQSRRREKHQRRGNRKGQKTYSKKGRRNSKQSVRSDASMSSTTQPNSASEEYYIKLGEGIVLDWQDEAFDALFGGSPSGDDLRGTFTFEPKQMQLAEDAALRAKLDSRRKRVKDGITLEDCFDETGKTEILSEENAWYCNRCKELRRASKTLEIWTAPDILVVHLKRFSGERYRRDKVDILVNFPIEGLDLTKRVGCKEDGKEYVYDLFAVDNHYGGLGGGHYTAYAKNFFDGKWYDFNDSFVSEQKPEGVVSTAAYLLFYRRRSSQPLGSPALQELVNKVRNPENDPDAADASDAEYGSSGEDSRLGDKSSASSRLPGSPNAGTVVAGAATGTHLRGGLGGHGNAANRQVRARMMSEDADDEGYQSGPLTNQQPSWGFGGLDDRDDADTSFNSLDSTNTPADTASDRPEAGSEYAESAGNRLLDELNDYTDMQGNEARSEVDWPGNQDQDDMFNDVDDSTYLDAKEHQGGMSMVHVGDGVAGADESDPSVKDITLDEE